MLLIGNCAFSVLNHTECQGFSLSVFSSPLSVSSHHFPLSPSISPSSFLPPSLAFAVCFFFNVSLASQHLSLSSSSDSSVLPVCILALLAFLLEVQPQQET